MIIPEIKIKEVNGDIVCTIIYDGQVVEAGYKPDGTTFVLSDESMMKISLEFTRISCKMWDVVCKKFNMNPGNALEIDLINLKYCRQMQIIGMIGYDLCNMICNKEKSHRDIKEFFEKHLK